MALNVFFTESFRRKRELRGNAPFPMALVVTSHLRSTSNAILAASIHLPLSTNDQARKKRPTHTTHTPPQHGAQWIQRDHSDENSNSGAERPVTRRAHCRISRPLHIERYLAPTLNLPLNTNERLKTRSARGQKGHSNMALNVFRMRSL